MKRPEELVVSAQQRAEFVRLMTGGRMNAYAAAVLRAQQKGREVDPLDLYVYNMALAGALLGPLHMLEVVTRNAVHHELTTWAGRDDWWVVGTRVVLLPRHQKKIADCVAKVEGELRGRRPVLPGDVVAATDLGFWTGLLGRGRTGQADYQVLWDGAIRHAFPHTRRRREQVWGRFNAMRLLRNRIGHHEHLMKTDAARNLATIVELIGWVSGPMAEWVDDRSRVPAVLERHPFAGTPATHF